MTVAAWLEHAAEFCMGALHWSEVQFWATSLHAYERALSGYAKANGHGGPRATMSRSRLAALMAAHPDKEPTR